MSVDKSPSLHTQVGHAGLWVVIRQILVRGLAIVQLLLLARILSPTEFGLFAVAMMVYAFIEAMTFLGFGHALIQRKTVAPVHLNTLFVVNIVRGVLLGMMVFGLSGPVSWLMNSPTSQPLIEAIGFLPLIMGFHNPAMIIFQKELRMKQELAFYFAGALTNLGVSLALAQQGHGPWALIAGLIAQATTQLVVSYLIQSYRPTIQFSQSAFSEMFHFGKWLMATQGLKYFSNNLPSWVIGHYLGVQALGLYHVAGRFSQAIGNEFAALISTVAFPAFAKIQCDKERLADAYVRSQKIVLSASFLVFSCMIALADPFVQLFLGDKWNDAADIIILLTLIGAIQTVGSQAEVLKAVGRTKIIFQLNVIRLLLVSILIVPATLAYEEKGAVVAMLIPAFILSPFGQIVILQELSIKSLEFIRVISPPICSMTLIVISSRFFYFKELDILHFSAYFVVTLIIYISSMMIMDGIFGAGIIKQWRLLVRRFR